MQNKIEIMNRMLEFEVLVILQDDQTQKWEDMGITPSEDNMEQRFVKYSFDPSTVVEMRQTFVEYKGEWLDAVVCTYTENNFETPPLLVHYNEFKRMLDEYNKESTEA